MLKTGEVRELHKTQEQREFLTIGGEVVVGKLVLFRPYSRVAVIESLDGQRYLIRTKSRKPENLDAMGKPRKRKGAGNPGQKYRVTYPDGQTRDFKTATEVCKAFGYSGTAVAHLRRTKMARGNTFEKI